MVSLRRRPDPGGPLRTLLLLRHAKSSWDDDALPDHDRPLGVRGRKAAKRMGRHLRDAGPRPDLALCSTAVRARETLERVLGALPDPPEVVFDRALYLASADRLAEQVAAAPPDARVLLVAAHNPGMAELGARLAERGDPEARARLRRKFPTAALAAFTGDAGTWRELVAGGCALEAFVRPKDL